MDSKTMWVSRPVSDSESEQPVVVDRKGKRKAAEPAKRKVKVEKVEKPKEKAERPKASGSKARTKRPAPKSTPLVADTSEDEVIVMDEQSGEDEPKPKRARVAPSKSQTALSHFVFFIFV